MGVLSLLLIDHSHVLHGNAAGMLRVPTVQSRKPYSLLRSARVHDGVTTRFENRDCRRAWHLIRSHCEQDAHQCPDPERQQIVERESERVASIQDPGLMNRIAIGCPDTSIVLDAIGREAHQGEFQSLASRYVYPVAESQVRSGHDVLLVQFESVFGLVDHWGYEQVARDRQHG